MKKLTMVVMMVVMMMVATTNIYASSDLQKEQYDLAIDQLVYYNYKDYSEPYCTVLMKPYSARWEAKVYGEDYYAIIYNISEDYEPYGSIYTKNDSFVDNLTSEDAREIIGQFN